jgi:peptidoglycan/xylan/chitin deacetylase (PgdA/CDA1 family)
VSDDNDSIYPPITTHDFNRLLLYIAKHFTVVDFNNFSRPSSKPKVILSFDDGYADFVENVMPMLLKLELPSIQNIIFNTVEHQNLFWTQELNILFNAIKSTNHRFQFQSPDLSFSCTPLNHESQYMYVFNKLRAFDKSSRQRVLNEMEALLPGCVHHSAPRMMTWDDIVYCSRNNVTIGSHTLSHDLLNTITDPSVLKVEIVESKQKIEEKIGTNVSVLCFPNGEYNQQSVLLAREAGYKHLLTTENYAWNPAHQQLLIPRVQMYAGSYEEMVCRVHLLHSYLKYK